jgi:two-component system, chemotaxis family, sensor kinase CheA
VHLRAFHQGGNLVIEVQDDGAGLVAEKLRAKAIEKGVITPNQNLTEKECHHLIFAPGFSTKTEVTDVSGRGVGMDVVRTNIEALQGDIQIHTEQGKGTRFTIQLPLTLAIITGMIVKSSTERYVIPLSHVHETVRPHEKDVSNTVGIGQVFNLRGETLPVFRLSQLLGRNAESTPIHDMTFVVLRQQGQAFAIALDEIISQTQVVIKQLGPEHKNIKGLVGSAILGDGQPALILELTDLAQKYKVKNETKSPQRRQVA